MNISTWYSVALAASYIIVAFWRLSRSTRFRFSYHDRHYLSSRIRSFFLTAALPRLILWRWNILHVLFVLIFIASNGLATGLSLYGLDQLQTRAGILGAINLAPAFVGRRICTSNLLGVSTHSYHLAHGVLATVGVVQAALHAGVAVRTATTIPNPFPTTFDQQVFYSGLAALVLLSLLLGVLPLLWTAFPSSHFVLSAHVGLAILSVPVLCWHIALTSQSGMIVASVFGGLVFIITAYPRLNSWLNGKGAVQQVVQLGDATVVQVQSKKALRTYPGCYYYIIPSAFSMAANTPHLVYHWEKIDTGVEAYTTTTTTSDIFLLVQDSPEWIRQKVQVLLDGPYGYNAHPEMYETVVLVAQGRGIAGVLPAASHIARISRRSRITRRIDLQWKLDQNDDEEWAEERLQNLIHLDPHRSLFAAHLYYPRLRARPLRKLNIPEKHSKQWNSFRLSHDDSMNRIRRNIDAKSRCAGHMIVMACGDPNFTGDIQKFVFQLPTLATFSRIDFQAGSGKKVSTRDIVYVPNTTV